MMTTALMLIEMVNALKNEDGVIVVN